MSAEGDILRNLNAAVIQLQWGRALMSAEGIQNLRSANAALTASMGPRSDERGRNFDFLAGDEIWVLQWGRALMSAEGRGMLRGLLRGMR